jgi:hypothetical protein
MIANKAAINAVRRASGDVRSTSRIGLSHWPDRTDRMRLKLRGIWSLLTNREPNMLRCCLFTGNSSVWLHPETQVAKRPSLEQGKELIKKAIFLVIFQ